MADNVDVLDSRRNTVDVSGSVIGSNISVNQNQDGTQSIHDRSIDYEVDESSYKVISSEPARRSLLIFYITLGIATLGVLADIAGLLAYIGIGQGLILIILAPICWLVSLITKHDRWLADLPEDGQSHYNQGQWYEKLDNGNVAIYLKKAKCIFPRCGGVVNIIPAPAREQPNHTLVGRCSLGGVQHTYTVDFNGVGYPKQFDWRPLPLSEKMA